MVLTLWFRYLCLLPKFAACLFRDLILYIKGKRWLIFEGWGLHLYVGKFGAGKTSTLVRDAYLIAKKYPGVTILTNVVLCNFPTHTQIIPLNNVNDILDAPPDTLVIIDEIGTIFNSRDFMGKEKSIPKILFQHLCQCRKRHIQILATTQRWNFLDKQLRDIADTVTVSSIAFAHPFSRLCTSRVFDAKDYDRCYSNPNYNPDMIGVDAYVQTDFMRNLYDTSELVETLLQAEYLPDSEIMANRGDIQPNISELTRKGSKGIRRNRGLL